MQGRNVRRKGNAGKRGCADTDGMETGAPRRPQALEEHRCMGAGG